MEEKLVRPRVELLIRKARRAVCRVAPWRTAAFFTCSLSREKLLSIELFAGGGVADLAGGLPLARVSRGVSIVRSVTCSKLPVPERVGRQWSRSFRRCPRFASRKPCGRADRGASPLHAPRMASTRRPRSLDRAGIAADRDAPSGGETSRGGIRELLGERKSPSGRGQPCRKCGRGTLAVPADGRLPTVS